MPICQIHALTSPCAILRPVMFLSRRRTAHVIRGPQWSQDYGTVVAGVAGHGQASIPPREGWH